METDRHGAALAEIRQVDNSRVHHKLTFVPRLVTP